MEVLVLGLSVAVAYLFLTLKQQLAWDPKSNQYDAHNRPLGNVSPPHSATQVVTKAYSDTAFYSLHSKIDTALAAHQKYVVAELQKWGKRKRPGEDEPAVPHKKWAEHLSAVAAYVPFCATVKHGVSVEADGTLLTFNTVVGGDTYATLSPQQTIELTQGGVPLLIEILVRVTHQTTTHILLSVHVGPMTLLKGQRVPVASMRAYSSVIATPTREAHPLSISLQLEPPEEGLVYPYLQISPVPSIFDFVRHQAGMAPAPGSSAALDQIQEKHRQLEESVGNFAALVEARQHTWEQLDASVGTLVVETTSTIPERIKALEVKETALAETLATMEGKRVQYQDLLAGSTAKQESMNTSLTAQTSLIDSAFIQIKSIQDNTVVLLTDIDTIEKAILDFETQKTEITSQLTELRNNLDGASATDLRRYLDVDLAALRRDISTIQSDVFNANTEIDRFMYSNPPAPRSDAETIATYQAFILTKLDMLLKPFQEQINDQIRTLTLQLNVLQRRLP